MAVGQDLPQEDSLLRRGTRQGQKLRIEVDLDNCPRSAYTTLDGVEGTVRLTALQRTKIDSIDIELIGSSKSRIGRVARVAACSGRSEAFHQFLKLHHPSVILPTANLLEPDGCHEIPFRFIIPRYVLPHTCRHPVVGDSLREQHLQLPPSFGEDDILDDSATQMARIRYYIVVRIFQDVRQNDEATGAAMIGFQTKLLRVLPTLQEQPPLLQVDDAESEYTMRREKTIRRGMFSAKVGTLVMEAAQPPSLHFKIPGDECLEQQPSMAVVALRFDPVDENSLPPRLSSLSSKLRICTHFTVTAQTTIPTERASVRDIDKGLHIAQLDLTSHCLTSVEWMKHDVRNRDDANPTEANPATPRSSAAYRGGSFYTARLVIPINLPEGKEFVPTFHSCLIGRLYQLKLELGLQGPALQGGVELRLPIQLSCGSSSVHKPEEESLVRTADMRSGDGALSISEESQGIDGSGGQILDVCCRADSVVLPAEYAAPPEYG